jgi:hypothetical protein
MKSPIAIRVGFLLTLVLPGTLSVEATTLEKVNVGQLIEYGELILIGRVSDVSDGFAVNGLPYTEITLQVGEAIKGNVGETYRFRQFGLVAPRDMGDGRVYVGVSPDGWPRFEVGEEVVVFLHATTSLGFQTTAGLFQGKFKIENGQVYNGLENAGLFAGVTTDRGLLSKAEGKMLDIKRGRCPVGPFKSFVRKAVEQNWFE